MLYTAYNRMHSHPRTGRGLAAARKFRGLPRRMEWGERHAQSAHPATIPLAHTRQISACGR